MLYLTSLDFNYYVGASRSVCNKYVLLKNKTPTKVKCNIWNLVKIIKYLKCKFLFKFLWLTTVASTKLWIHELTCYWYKNFCENFYLVLETCFRKIT